MNERTDKLARWVVNNGKPFQYHEVDEGTPESGPYTRSWYGFRCGQLTAQIHKSGRCFLATHKGHFYPITDNNVRTALEEVRTSLRACDTI